MDPKNKLLAFSDINIPLMNPQLKLIVVSQHVIRGGVEA
jgi:hypothetical protein